MIFHSGHNLGSSIIYYSRDGLKHHIPEGQWTLVPLHKTQVIWPTYETTQSPAKTRENIYKHYTEGLKFPYILALWFISSTQKAFNFFIDIYIK